MNRSLGTVVVISLATLMGCQGAFNVDFDKAHLDGGASSSGGGGSSSGGEVPNPTTAGTIAGTWDISGAIPGEHPATGTLDVGANSFRVAISGVVFDFSAAGDRTLLTYTRYGETHGVDVDHREDAVSWGILPITKGGSLTFTDPTRPTQPCLVEIGAKKSTFQCTAAPDGWPKAVLPRPNNGTRYEMSRLDVQPSSFGDLGGRWQANILGGTDICSITFAGDKISASCPGSVKQLGGKFDATFSSEVVSGHLSGGIEFAGQKR